MHLLARIAPFWRGARCAAAAAPQSQLHLIVPSPLYPVRRAASIECDTPPYTHATLPTQHALPARFSPTSEALLGRTLTRHHFHMAGVLLAHQHRHVDIGGWRGALKVLLR